MIPDGIVSIGPNCVKGILDGSMVIPESVTSISPEAFASGRVASVRQVPYPKDGMLIASDGQTLITPIQLENLNKIPDNIRRIGPNAFAGMEIESLTLPDCVTELSPDAFRDSMIDTIYLSNSIKNIPENCFYNAECDYIYLPDKLETISDRAFYYLDWDCVLAVNGKISYKGQPDILPDTVRSIGDMAFTANPVDAYDEIYPDTMSISEAVAYSVQYNMASEKEQRAMDILSESRKSSRFTDLESVLSNKIPVEEEDYYDNYIERYEGEDSAKEIQLPAITDIGKAFAGSEYSEIILPDTLEKIDNEAFAGCIFLQSIDIPGSVKTIGEEAFINCANLKTVTMHEGTEKAEQNAFFGCSIGTAYLPESLVELDGAFPLVDRVILQTDTCKAYEVFADNPDVSLEVYFRSGNNSDVDWL